MTKKCPFCELHIERIVLKNELCFATWDINPVSKGHMLLIPFRHLASFFETTRAEQGALMDLVFQARELLDARYKPAGYNFGVNIGETAGQLIMHVHFHLIPRYRGDTKSGSGLRHVIAKPCVWQPKLSEFTAEREK